MKTGHIFCVIFLLVLVTSFGHCDETVKKTEEVTPDKQDSEKKEVSLEKDESKSEKNEAKVETTENKPEGSATSAGENATSTSGNATSTTGNATSATGNATSTSGNATSATGNATSTSGNATSATGNGTAEGNTTKDEVKFVDKVIDETGIPVCLKPRCKRKRDCSVPCHNGRCRADGECQCDECWIGETCNEYNSACYDRFDNQQQNDHDEDAHDMDDNPYTDEDGEHRSRDDDSPELSPGKKPRRRKKRAVKKRRKRAARPYPKSLTFKLTKVKNYDNQQIHVGDLRKFKLTVTFPQKTDQDVLVELFTPDNDTTVMMLCNVQVTHQGKHLKPTPIADLTKMAPVMDARVGLWPYDRAILNLGKVTCESGASPSDKKEIELHIEFEALMIESKFTDKKTYWVSAGAEYNKENEIWVGQASFKANRDKDLNKNSAKPEFALKNPPSNMKIGQSVEFILNMKISHYSVAVNIDSIAPLDESSVISICGILVYSSDLSYKCVPKDIFQYKTFKDANGVCSGRARLELGRITNAARRHPAGTTYDAKKDDNLRVAIYAQAYKKSKTPTDVKIGFTVEVGETSVWAGEQKVTILDADPKPPKLTKTPTVYLHAPTVKKKGEPAKAPRGGAIAFNLTITTLEKSMADYKAELIMPFVDKKAQLRICKVELCYNGWNVPCVIPTDPVLTSKNKDTDYDHASVDLGRITNHALLPGNETANTVTICFYVSVMNHPKNIPGAKMWVTAGLNLNGEKLWVGQRQVEVDADKVFDTKYAPVMSLSYGFGDENVKVGEMTDVRFEIATKGLYKYSPVDIEVIMPFENNASVLSLCHAELLYTGKNLPCMKRKELNATFTLHSKNKNKVNNRATISFKNMYNVIENDKNDTNDKVVIRTVIKVEDHPYTVKKPAIISAGIVYTEESLWVGQVNLNAVRGKVSQLSVEDAKKLRVSVEPANGKATAAPGDSKLLRLNIKFPPLSSSDYDVKVVVKDKATSLCRMQISELGHNMKCVDKSPVANFTKWPKRKTNQAGQLALGIITNPGGEEMEAGSKFDKTSVAIDVAVALSASATGKLKVEATVFYFDDQSTTVKQTVQTVGTIQVQKSGAASTSNGTRPDFTFKMAPILDYENLTQTSAELNPGQHFRAFLDIELKPDSCVKLKTKFMGPLEKGPILDITNIRVWGIGASMPCFIQGGQIVNFTSRAGSITNDIGSLDLGQVCSFPGGETGVAFRRLRVEVIARLRLDVVKKKGDWFWFNTVVKINDDQVYVGQIKLTVTDQFNEIGNPDPSVQGTVVVDNKDLLVRGYPHSIHDIPFTIMVPPNSTSKSVADVKVPINDTACMTISKIKLTRCGKNIAKMCDDTFKYIYNSTLGNSQNDRAFINLAIVTNTGVTYREEAADPALDDSIEITATIMAGDALNMVKDSEHIISFGATLGKFVMVAEPKLRLLRNGSERPVYEVKAAAGKGSYAKAEPIKISGTMKHHIESRAEGQQVHLKFFIPDYMYFDGPLNLDLTPLEYNKTKDYFTIVWERFLFTDVANFDFLLKVKPDGVLPTRKATDKITIPYEAGSHMNTRPGNLMSSSFIVSEMAFLQFTLTNMGAGGPVVGVGVGTPSDTGCKKTLDLGLSDVTKIKDCQLTSSYQEKTDPGKVTNIRKGSTGWKPFIRKGDIYEQYRYFQVHFWNRTVVTQVEFFQPAGATCHVTEFKSAFSDDLMGWVESSHVQVNKTYDGTKGIKVDVADAKPSYAFRVYLTKDNCGDTKVFMLTVNLYGCEDAANTKSDARDPCQYTPLSWTTKDYKADHGHREFVVGTSETFFCDADPKDKLKMSCFSTKNVVGGTSAKRLSKMATHVIGYDSKYGELYAYARNERAYLCSQNGGKDWFTVPKSRWDEVEKDKTRNVAKVTKVPWKEVGTLGDTSPNIKDVSKTWAAGYKGLYRKGSSGSWDMVTDWTKCCAP